MSNHYKILNVKMLVPAAVGFFLVLFLLYGSCNYLQRNGKSSVKVTRFQPSGEVHIRSNFTIDFSRDMVVDAVVNTPIDSLPVKFEPAIPGLFKWISKRRLRFFPDEPLRPSTEYVAEILPEICQGNQLHLESDATFRFFTPRFKVEHAQIEFRFTDKTFSNAIVMARIEFNYAADPGQLKHNLTLHQGKNAAGPKLDYDVQTTQPGNVITVVSEPVPHKQKEMDFSLKIADGFTGFGCQLGLLGDFIQSKTLGKPEPLKLNTIYANQSERSSWITIRFSTTVDASEANRYISVKPEVNYRIEQSGPYLHL
ncbi:hypothetical protein JXJ21_19680, partial [candidate division KSB1 bacterium]|nr:hypothetical protein [candidate division KSB1 bacterium]